MKESDLEHLAARLRGGWEGVMGQALVTTLITCVTFVFVFGIVPVIAEGAASEWWPTAPGFVVWSQVTEAKDDEDSPMFSPDVRYRYVVGEVTFESGRISSSSLTSSSLSRATARVNRYAVGQKLTVSYDPARPSHAVLEPGVGAGAALVFCITVAFTILSLLMIVGLVGRLNGSIRPLGELVRAEPTSYIQLTQPSDPLALTCWTCIIAIAGLVFTIGGPIFLFDLSGWLTLGALALMVPIAPIAAHHFYKSQNSHADDLRIDFGNRWVLLPSTAGAISAVPVPFSSIEGISSAPNTALPDAVDVLLEFTAVGEDYSQTARLLSVPGKDGAAIAARIKSHLN